MTLRISSKNVDIGESLRAHVEARIDDAVDKYFDGNYSGNLVFEREGSGCRADCSIHLDTGIVLQASAQAQEPQSSLRPGRRAHRKAAPALQAQAEGPPGRAQGRGLLRRLRLQRGRGRAPRRFQSRCHRRDVHQHEDHDGRHGGHAARSHRVARRRFSAMRAMAASTWSTAGSTAISAGSTRLSPATARQTDGPVSFGPSFHPETPPAERPSGRGSRSDVSQRTLRHGSERPSQPGTPSFRR